MIDVSIVIVTYNSARVISSCISSIQSHKTNLTYEIIIVDNNSKDETRTLVRSFAHVLLIQNNKNLGFSKANNIGIKAAKGKYIMILNPDVILIDYALDQLIQSLIQQDRCAIVAPKLVYRSGEVQESVRKFPSLFIQLFGRIPILKNFVEKKHNEYLMKDWNHTQSGNVDWVIGAALLSNKETLHNIGMFDENFFLYCEDIDLCYRFFKQGYNIYYDSRVTLVHEYQKDSSKRVNGLTFVHLSSIFKFYRKHPELIMPREIRKAD